MGRSVAVWESDPSMMLRKPSTWIPAFLRARTRSRAPVALPDPRVDALLDTYGEWREECEEVERAYERWTGSERAERRFAYAAYRAALDREEKAAAVYQVTAAELVGAAREPHRGRATALADDAAPGEPCRPPSEPSAQGADLRNARGRRA